jgi:hypothetical protein
MELDPKNMIRRGLPRKDFIALSAAAAAAALMACSD